MLNLNDALRRIAQSELPDGPRSSASRVVAIVRLSETGRAWFVTGVQHASERLYVAGYDPGCLHSFGERWFLVAAEFFEMAARATEEQVTVEVLPSPVPLGLIEDPAI